MAALALQDNVTAYHAVRFLYDPARARVWSEICRYLQRFVPEQEPLLDLGAGYGEFSRCIRASEKWALDVNPELVRYWGDPLPIRDGSLGSVFASNFFEYFSIDQGRSILSEVRRVLKPSGRFIAVQPNFRLEPGRYFDDYTHVTPFTECGFADRS